MRYCGGRRISLPNKETVIDEEVDMCMIKERAL